MLTIALFFTACSNSDNDSAEIASGTTGSLAWRLTENGTLTISGNGAVPNYDAFSPWYSHREIIKKVIINNGITSIGDCVFSHYENLISVTIPNSVTSIKYFAFYGCKNLKSIIIPNSVESIDESAFEHCSSLSSIIIPIGVEYIGESAFSRCIGLTSITINGETNIEHLAFSGCSGLTEITIKATVPPNLHPTSFYNVSRSVPVYVPQTSLQVYKDHSIWGMFTNIQGKTF